MPTPVTTTPGPSRATATAQPGPSTTTTPEEATLAATAARAVGDVVNSVYEYVADGFDAFDATVLKSMQLTPDAAAALLKGSVTLHAHLQARVDVHLAAFEVASLEGPLRPPVGALPPAPSSPAACATPADEAAADTDLEAARTAARAARASAGRARRELAALGAEVAAWGNAGPLAAVATAGGATGGTGGWAGKENAAADAAAIATKALALAALVPRAEAAAAAAPDVGRDAGDAVLAEVEAFRAAAGGVDAGALRRLRELVAPTA